MICAVCLRALDRRTDAFGVRWLHTSLDPAAHTPQPVPMPSGWTGGRCDFCSANNPSWELPARSFKMPLTTHHGSEGGWAACDTCADLIRENRWDTVLDRACEQFGPPARPALRVMYRRLRANVTGPVRRIAGVS
jgi:hypothetical protein